LALSAGAVKSYHIEGLRSLSARSPREDAGKTVVAALRRYRGLAWGRDLTGELSSRAASRSGSKRGQSRPIDQLPLSFDSRRAHGLPTSALREQATERRRWKRSTVGDDGSATSARRVGRWRRGERMLLGATRRRRGGHCVVSPARQRAERDGDHSAPSARGSSRPKAPARRIGARFCERYSS
jgi:hypothetical protein